MVLSYDFERLIMSQAATDTDFKHLIDLDDNLLSGFRLAETMVENGRPGYSISLASWAWDSGVRLWGDSLCHHIDYDYFDSQAGDFWYVLMSFIRFIP